MVAAAKEQPLVSSLSADTMHLPAAAVMDIAKVCSGPDGCSVGVLIQYIAKGGLMVSKLRTAQSPCACCLCCSVIIKC